MKYEGNKVIISESEIRYLVKESVKNYLNEMEEGALWNAFKKKGTEIGQGMANMGRNMMNTRRAGIQDKRLQQYANNLIASIDTFIKMAGQYPDMAELVRASGEYENRIRNVMSYSSDNLANISSRTFSTNRY